MLLWAESSLRGDGGGSPDLLAMRPSWSAAPLCLRSFCSSLNTQHRHHLLQEAPLQYPPPQRPLCFAALSRFPGRPGLPRLGPGPRAIRAGRKGIGQSPIPWDVSLSVSFICSFIHSFTEGQGWGSGPGGRGWPRPRRARLSQ